jgi:C-terminal processing protease CtpA/Prc
MTIAIKSMPQGLVIGETTWGATGPIADRTTFTGGSFNVGQFMSVETSSAAFKDTNGRSYEKSAVIRDITVPYDLDYWRQAPIHSYWPRSITSAN